MFRESPLECLAYVSEAKVPFDERSAADLARRSETRNRQNGVSGYLHYARGRFLQYFEGESGAVEDLLRRLHRDERHELIAVSRGHSLVERRFERWAMRYVRHTEVVEIGLETLLSDRLLFLKRLEGEIGNLDASVWRLVEGLAEQYKAM